MTSRCRLSKTEGTESRRHQCLVRVVPIILTFHTSRGDDTCISSQQVPYKQCISFHFQYQRTPIFYQSRPGTKPMRLIITDDLDKAVVKVQIAKLTLRNVFSGVGHLQRENLQKIQMKLIKRSKVYRQLRIPRKNLQKQVDSNNVKVQQVLP